MAKNSDAKIEHVKKQDAVNGLKSSKTQFDLTWQSIVTVSLWGIISSGLK